MYANEAREPLIHRVWETDQKFLPVLILIRSALVLAVDLYLDLTEAGRPPTLSPGCAETSHQRANPERKQGFGLAFQGSRLELLNSQQTHTRFHRSEFHLWLEVAKPQRQTAVLGRNLIDTMTRSGNGWRECSRDAKDGWGWGSNAFKPVLRSEQWWMDQASKGELDESQV